jgi:hypothetical protein
MKCFNHPDQDAVAQCRACSKGLCRPCSQEGTGGIACSETCREELVASQRYIQDVQEVRTAKKRAIQFAWYYVGITAVLTAGFLTYIGFMLFTLWREEFLKK